METKKTKKTYNVAQQILGDDIIFTEEIAKARGLSYGNAELKHFVKTMSSEEVLRWCKAHGCIVMAGPPSPIGLLGVRSISQDLFRLNCEDDNWYEKDPFSEDDEVKAEWLVVRKSDTCYSRDSESVILKRERVPNAAEVSWFLTTYYKVRGGRFFERYGSATTCSYSSRGDRVIIKDDYISKSSIIMIEEAEIHDIIGVLALLKLG